MSPKRPNIDRAHRRVRLNALLCPLILAGGAGIAVAAETPRPPVQVTVTAKGCEPAQLTVPAGTTTFQIINKSSRALEWEILKGVIVVDERENIAPGFTQKLTTKLDAGDYQITCGLLSNPQGKLTVTGSDTPAIEASIRPTATDLIGPSAEYRVYLYGETTTLAAATTAMAGAIAAGDLAKASDRYAVARAAYLHLKPAVALFADLDARIDGASQTGFRRLADGLFVAKSTADLGPVAGSLNADVTKLQGQLKSGSATPEIMIKGAAQVIDALAREVAAPGQSALQATDLADLRAQLAGARKVVDLFTPIATRTDKASAERIAAELTDIERKLAAPAPTDSDRKDLGDALGALAGHVSKLSVTLGLSQS